MPAAEGLVVAGVAVDRDADVDLAAVQLLRGRASAASTAPNTTSRSTVFSREIASTSISISRFIDPDLRQPLTAPRPPRPRLSKPVALEVHHRHQPGLAHLVEREAEDLVGLAIVELQAPTLFTPPPSRPRKFLRPWKGFQRHGHFQPGEAHEVGFASERPVQSRRRDFQTFVVEVLDFQHVLQLPRDRSQSSTVTNSLRPAGIVRSGRRSIITRSRPRGARSTSTRS
jgi:hypothetical protein